VEQFCHRVLGGLEGRRSSNKGGGDRGGAVLSQGAGKIGGTGKVVIQRRGRRQG
jgi:hypothetical protein